MASSSLGSLVLFKINTNLSETYDFVREIEWDQIHGFKNCDAASCTSFALYENDIVSVGEDGRINLLAAQRKDVLRTIDNADSCSLNCVTFLKHNEILTSNTRGQMKIWDLRSNKDVPANTFMLSGDQVMPTCLVHHPTQRHLLVAGDEDGKNYIFNLPWHAILLFNNKKIISKYEYMYL